MNKETDTDSKVGYVPTFHKSYLHPRYWGIWAGVGVLAGLAYVPVKLRDPLLAKIGWLAGKFAKGARRRARINLCYCMPELTGQQREALIDKMFSTAPQPFVMLAEMYLRGTKSALNRTHWHGEEITLQLKEQGKNIIFMVPHGWAVDIPAILLTANGQKAAAMFHHQKNPVSDYLWNKARSQFGGRLHSRDAGIKPFIASVRQGFWGYYLPDQDHGEEHSEFVDFFATYKATLPAIGRLMKVCRAAIVPLFPVYNYRTHQLDIYIRPPMDDIDGKDDAFIARRMNEELEQLVRPNPEQYTWILKLLKTRKQGDIEPYNREDL
ncbi:lauroyl-Kdo(2)-lipid IV(A) myristoyltransferase [Photorhabdus heterorhabditis]|uniref:Lipid A biosynthesis acyltransferase n=1 Tax=Photorhabdus heterorhabditis TaxID=880156 RepID=A0A5B0WM73_9GAMM|nr:lauroyl-Kdo(2)-lipid IV(A) myristoyltransferase [Photorhabdus heterorhabditis]KAA1187311.1 lauroyl-Kdo(2)-lipid IV(A) myristoyltransferase [Photorhabdus heterorhabditis]KOY63212.1 lipid A biosynthesis (KDO)2-(lauroyl)-lipid IVA acyltransferase [Photorhabdus heterorhabditis]MBS9443493.1 lauroyl-Kdo(2)-lipid IV(A) myristoyltransferase [Photorhabdus heterorhabditis]